MENELEIFSIGDPNSQSGNPSKIQNKPPLPTLGRLQFASPAEPKIAKPKREPKPKVKNDPKLVAAARELRDRGLEQVNADASALFSQGKYEVSRALAVVERKATLFLENAA